MTVFFELVAENAWVAGVLNNTGAPMGKKISKVARA